MKTFFIELFKKDNQGPWPLIITLGLMLVGSVTVYQSPRSLFAFLTLMLCPMMLYFLKINTKTKIFIGLLLAIVIIPVLGIRNIFYLEVIFQIWDGGIAP